MKRVKHFVGCLMLLASALSLVACHLDELRGNGEFGQGNSEVGYLQLKSLVLNVDNESFDLNADTEISTRAGEDNQNQTNTLYEVPNPNNIVENIDNYWVEVYDEIDKVTVDINGDASGVGCYYKDLPAEGIALEAGRYTVYVYKTQQKGSDIEDVIADVPGTQPEAGVVLAYYMGSAPATVTSGVTTNVEVTCKLANVLTTVELSADLIKWFKKDDNGDAMLSTNVAIAAANDVASTATEPYTFPYTSNHGIVDEETGKVVGGGPFVYFKDVAGPTSASGNVLQLNMTGTFYTGLEIDIDNNNIDNTKWADVSMSRTITDVKAAQWRRISIDIDRNNEGNIQFKVTVESYVYDKTIDVDVVTLYSALNIEEEVPDVGVENPKAPNVSIKDVVADENGALNYAINSTMYDADAEGWNTYLKVNVAPQDNTTIKEIYAIFSSDNASLLPAMESKGFAEGRMDIYSDVSAQVENGDASEYVKVTDVANGVPGEKLITVKAAGMSALYKYAGTHTVSVYTVDSENRKKHTDIIITVTKGGGGAPPTIVWMKGGVDVIDERHTLNAENAATFECKIDMASETGFTTLEVDIISSVLTDAELAGVGLGSHIDLINPTEDQVGALQGLGFLKTGQTSCRGELEASFDISGFMGMLYGIFPDSDNCDFNITVGDANGETKKSLMFYVDKPASTEDN